MQSNLPQWYIRLIFQWLTGNALPAGITWQSVQIFPLMRKMRCMWRRNLHCFRSLFLLEDKYMFFVLSCKYENTLKITWIIFDPKQSTTETSLLQIISSTPGSAGISLA